MAAAAGFPVPAPLIVDLPVGFPWNYGTDEFHDLVRKSPGPNLGLALIPGAILKVSGRTLFHGGAME